MSLKDTSDKHVIYRLNKDGFISKKTAEDGVNRLQKCLTIDNCHPTQADVNLNLAKFLGRADIDSTNEVDFAYQRQAGGGRKSTLEKHPEVEQKIIDIVDTGGVYGSPEKQIKHSSKSLANIKKALDQEGYNISISAIRKIVRKHFSLQRNRKEECAGPSSPDRNAQFVSQRKLSLLALVLNALVLSVDMKKKEYIGNYCAKGREFRPKGDPLKTLDHDFHTKDQVILPYGFYLPHEKEGFVCLGTHRDCADFLLDGFKLFWDNFVDTHDNLPEVVCVFCDGGGSNSSRSRQWKKAMQEFSDYIGRPVLVSHSSPYTSKWNLIEHCLFNLISKNLRGTPITDINMFQQRCSSISVPTKCVICNNTYDPQKVSDTDFKHLQDNMLFAKWHKDWNYGFLPANASQAQREKLQFLLDFKDQVAFEIERQESAAAEMKVQAA